MTISLSPGSVRRTLPLVALASLAGCGGSSDNAPKSTVAKTVPVPRSIQQPAKECPQLQPADVKRVVPDVGDVTVKPLAPTTSSGQECGSLLVTSAGAIALSFTVQPSRTPEDLRQVRALSVAQIRGRRHRAVPALGSGAFLAGDRILGFARNGKIALLQTGYDMDGKLALKPRDLERVAKLVAGRL